MGRRILKQDFSHLPRNLIYRSMDPGVLLHIPNLTLWMHIPFYTKFKILPEVT